MASSDAERFDDVLINIAGQLGGIEPLFDTLFSFLYRKTDYFHVMQPGDKMGFKAGVAQQILLRSFSKFERQAALTAKRASDSAAQKPTSQNPAPTTSAATPSTASQPKPAKPSSAAPKSGGGVSQTSGAAPARPSPEASAPVPTRGAGDAATSATAKQDHPQPGKDAPVADSSSQLAKHVGTPYNGGVCKTFEWEQTLHDVTIHAPVPEGTRARDVVCTISRNHLMLKVRGETEPLIDADYPCDARNGQEIWEKVKVDDSYWNLADLRGKPCVCVYLEKDREAWWKSAIHGGAEIDTTQVDSTRDMYDYDGETQGAIRKIMFDQHQKRLGKPTSEDLKNEEMLRAAWDAEGSPFKGQPFDPSMINMTGDASGPTPPGMPPPPRSSPAADDAPRITE